MTDTVSRERRSWIMSQVKGKDTAPELFVRSLVHRLGYRFRLHRRDLPGAPDLVFVSRRKVIFVHGCFWHGHHCARGDRQPKSNCDYWKRKIAKNKERDRAHRKQLHDLGWDVLVIWECQLRDVDLLVRRVKRFLGPRRVPQVQLFVTDEASAIQWLKQQLTRKPQTFQALHPQFLKEIGGWQKHEKPLELSELLEQNFLRYDGKGPIPAQLVSWMKQSADLRKIIQEELSSGRSTEENGQLETRNQELITRAKARWYVPDPNKASDLEELRERALLREFEEYLPAPRASRQAGRESKQKRLRVFRLEAIRAGFKKAWHERDYATIIAVARKIPENVLQEDPKLLMWYDQAVTRLGDTEIR